MVTNATAAAQTAPEWVRTALADAGLVSPSAPGLDAVRLAGRNETYRVQTPAGSYVAKRLQGPAATARFARSTGHAELGSGPLTPQLVHHDADALVLLFTTITDAISGSDLLVQESFSTRQCADLGSAVGQLHNAPLAAVAQLPTPSLSMPSDEALRALPLDLVSRFTAGEVQAWRLIQSDPQLPGYIRALRASSDDAQHTPIHGDLRVDQVLATSDALHIVDWEEFGSGDPARDTGSWIGEWIYRAILDIPTARGDGRGSQTGSVLERTDFTERDVIARGVAKLDAQAPFISAFWDSYRTQRKVEHNEIARVTAFAGWHMLDRLLAHAHSRPSLPGLHRAAAGIGKRILSNPVGAAEALGLMTPTTTVGAA